MNDSHDRSRWFSTVIPIWFPCHPHGERSTVEGESPVEAGPSAAVCWRSRGSPSAGGVGPAEPWNVARRCSAMWPPGGRGGDTRWGEKNIHTVTYIFNILYNILALYIIYKYIYIYHYLKIHDSDTKYSSNNDDDPDDNYILEGSWAGKFAAAFLVEDDQLSGAIQFHSPAGTEYVTCTAGFAHGNIEKDELSFWNFHFGKLWFPTVSNHPWWNLCFKVVCPEANHPQG
jgi:hypothetical protein